MNCLAERLYDGTCAKCEVEDKLDDAGVPHERIGWDYYDNSLEIYDVAPDYRMPVETQAIIHGMGFAKVYVNHIDKWETHYSWGAEFKPSRGWRRRYVQDPEATTTNVITGPPNPGYYEISRWPEGWSQKEWLDTGYMRIVPDPLEPTV